MIVNVPNLGKEIDMQAQETQKIPKYGILSKLKMLFQNLQTKNKERN